MPLTAASCDTDVVDVSSISLHISSAAAYDPSDQIVQVLGLDDSTDLKIIVKQLLVKGRQALVDVKDDIASDIYNEQMLENSDLLQSLRQYFEQEWQLITDEEWFQKFLNEQKQQSPNLYEQILTRTAEHGVKYMKDNPILSLVIQFVFEFDDDPEKDQTLFDDIWKKILSFGRQGLKDYAEYLAPATMNEQLTNDTSLFYLALQQYYRQPLKDILEGSKITDRMNREANIGNVVLNCVVNNGWWNGLNDKAVQYLIPSKKFTPMAKKLEQYLNDNNLIIPEITHNTDAAIAHLTQNNSTVVADILSTPQSPVQQIVFNTDPASATATAKTQEVLSQLPQTFSDTISSTHVFNTILSTTPVNDSSQAAATTSTVITCQLAIPSSQTFQAYPATQPEGPSTTEETQGVEQQSRLTETNLILSCINPNDELHLSNLVHAGELMYIGKKRDEILSAIASQYHTTKDFSVFVSECLTPIMYLLKRHQNLDDFMEALSFNLSTVFGILTSTLPNISLRMLIHVLLSKSDFPLRQMLMSMLCKRNVVPFIAPIIGKQLTQKQQQAQERKNYEIIPDIIHVWDYAKPILLSFGIGPCFGKSTLLNTLFQSTFEQSSSASIYFQQTVDIDFGYSFLPQRSISIADTHGQMTKQLLCKINHLFDGFILHVDYTYLEKNIDTILNFITVLPAQKFRLLLIRDSPFPLAQSCSSLLSTRFSESSIQTATLPHIADKDNKQNKNLVRTLRNTIFSTVPSACSHGNSYIKYELEQIISYDYKQHLTKMHNKIMPLEQKLVQLAEHTRTQPLPSMIIDAPTIDDPYVIQFYSEYFNFAELSKLQQKLLKLNFYGENDTKMHEVRQNIAERRQKQGSYRNDGGIIFNSFIELLKEPDMLMHLNLLAAKLKEHRNHYVSTGDQANQLPIHRNLSVEILWRNAIVCSRYQSPNNEDVIIRSYREYIKAGFPFEIIDGDNYHFPHSFLTKVLQDYVGKKILVISVIGPQNSGKSTLLNYMFGTFFDVRDGRCTRGIYGSFVKSNRREFDYIMLIDTEGLLGVEREDKEFDRRLVLFCLAASHLVIVNMIGEVNEALKTMLTLCVDSLKQMDVTRVPQPTVHFILNQKADLDIENNQTAINKIISDLKSSDLSGMIDIKPETFHTLPNAFKKQRSSLNDTSLPCLIKTEPDFIELVQLLCDDIINTALQRSRGSADTFTDPPNWLHSSLTIFDTLQKFADLTYYRDINERRQDHETRRYICAKLLQVCGSKYQEELANELANSAEQAIDVRLEIEMEKKHKELGDDLDNYLLLLKTTETIRTRSKQFLRVQIFGIFNAITTQCKMVSERALVQLLVNNGAGELKKLIDETIEKGTVLSVEEATNMFDNMYNTIIDNINKSFNPNDRAKTAVKHIYQNYNIYETDCLPDYQNDILNHVAWLQLMNEKKVEENDILNGLKSLFTKLGNEYPLVEEYPFTSDLLNPYSTDIVNNLVHLNKDLLKKCFNQFLSQNSVFESQRHHKSIPRRIAGTIQSSIALDKQKKYALASDKFLLRTREAIQHEHRDSQKDNSMIQNDNNHVHLQASKLIRSVLQSVVNATRASKPNVCSNARRKTVASKSDNAIRQIDTDLIQKIVGIINTLIKDINLELNPFCLRLNKPLKATFHTCTIILLARYYYNEQHEHFLQTLKTLSDIKGDLKAYFITRVCPTQSNEVNGAIALGTQVKEYIQKALATMGQLSINTNIGEYDYLNRKWIQDTCDGQILIATPEWSLNYIENPTTFIEKHFEDMWKQTIQPSIDRNLTQLKVQYNDILLNFFQCVEDLNRAIANKTRGTKVIDEIFNFDEATNSVGQNRASHRTTSLNVMQHLNNKRRCMAMLLFDYLTGQRIPVSFTCSNATYKITTDTHQTFDLFAQTHKPNDKLIALIKSMTTVFDSCSFDNLSTFLSRILAEKSKISNEFTAYKCDFYTIDKQDKYGKLIDKIRGCPDKCPCCLRPCDFDHTGIKAKPGSKDSKHRCETGHTLRAMNGYKFEETNEASLFMCEQITDDQTIVVGSIRKKWSQFKLDHSDWQFESLLSADELSNLHQKVLNIWVKIGRALCKKYDMNYVTFNTIRKKAGTQSYHCILLLDASASMRDTPWKDLIKALKEFLKQRKDLGTKDRITIITFAVTATIVYYDQELKDVDADKIPFAAGHDTNFSVAFTEVNHCITRSKKADSKYAIMFMTDGAGNDPEKELDTLNASHRSVIRKFWTVSLGQPSIAVLEKINKTMNGEYFDIETSSLLADAYAEIARTL